MRYARLFANAFRSSRDLPMACRIEIMRVPSLAEPGNWARRIAG